MQKKGLTVNHYKLDAAKGAEITTDRIKINVAETSLASKPTVEHKQV